MNAPPIDDPDFAPAGSLRAKGIDPMIHAELADGERLIWAGRPRRDPGAGSIPAGYRFACAAIGAMLGLLGLLCALVGILDPDRPGIMSRNVAVGGLIGAVAVASLAVGLRDVLGQFPATARFRAPSDPVARWFGERGRSTRYALTDRRIILWEPAGFRDTRVRSFRPRDLAGISRIQRDDGSGDLILESILGAQPNGLNGLIPLGCLRRVDDVRAVEALVRAALFKD